METDRVREKTELLIHQWNDAENIKSLIAIFIESLEENILDQIDELARMRRIDTARGVWLDHIAHRLGLRRPYSSDPAIDPTFGYDSAGEGFNQERFSGDSINDPLYPLPDIVFRKLIKARAVLDLSRGTGDEIRRAGEIIDENAVIDPKDNMTVRVITTDKWQFEIADRSGALPRNAGVLLEYRQPDNFGFDDAGQPFDVGSFV